MFVLYIMKYHLLKVVFTKIHKVVFSLFNCNYKQLTVDGV